MRSWHRGVLAALVLAAFCGSTWATCVEDATSSEMQQMACCKAGQDQCPMKDSASACCNQSGPQIQSQGTVVRAASFSASILVPLAWVTVPSVASAAHTQRRVSYDSSPPGLLVAPPAYIAFSALLI
jgi:hypothetical protein